MTTYYTIHTGALLFVSQYSPILVFDPVVLPFGILAHADPGVGMVELAVKQPARATLLLGTKQVLKATLGLCDLVGWTTLTASPYVVHVHLT